MFWQRSSSIKKNLNRGRDHSKQHDPILNLANNNDFLTDDENTRLKLKLNGLKGSLSRRSFQGDNNQDQINQLTNILREMQTQDNYVTPFQHRRSMSNIPANGRLKQYPSEIGMDFKPDLNGEDLQSRIPPEEHKNKKKLLSQEIQIQTLQQICDLLQHKNKALQSQVNHLRTLILDQDQTAHNSRQNVLKQALDKVFSLNNEIKEMNKQYEYDLQNMKNDHSFLEKENDILRKELYDRKQNDKRFLQPDGKQFSEMMDYIDDLKERLNQQIEENEQLSMKNNMFENKRVPLTLRPQDLVALSPQNNPYNSTKYNPNSGPQSARNTLYDPNNSNLERYQYYGGTTMDTVPQTTRNRIPDYDALSELDENGNNRGPRNNYGGGIRDTIAEARQTSLEKNGDYQQPRSFRSNSRQQGLQPLNLNGSGNIVNNGLTNGLRPRSNSVIKLKNQVQELQKENEELKDKLKLIGVGSNNPMNTSINNPLLNTRRTLNTEVGGPSDLLIDDLKKENKDQQNELRRLKYELELKLQQSDDMKQTINDVEDLRNKNKELRDQLSNLREQQTMTDNDALNQLSTMTGQIKAYEDKYDMISAQMEGKQREIREIRSELTRKDIDCKELEQLVQQLQQRERQRKENERRELQRKIQQERKEIERLQQERRDQLNRPPPREMKERIHSPSDNNRQLYGDINYNNNFYSARRKTNDPMRPGSMPTEERGSNVNGYDKRQPSAQRVSSVQSVQENKLYEDIIEKLQNLEDQVKNQRLDNEILISEGNHHQRVLEDIYNCVRAYNKEIIQDPQELDYALNDLNDNERRQQKLDSRIAIVIRNLLLTQQQEENGLKSKLFQNVQEQENFRNSLNELEVKYKELEKFIKEQEKYIKQQEQLGREQENRYHQLENYQREQENRYHILEENYKISLETSNNSADKLLNDLKTSRRENLELNDRLNNLEAKLGEQETNLSHVEKQNEQLQKETIETLNNQNLDHLNIIKQIQEEHAQQISDLQDDLQQAIESAENQKEQFQINQGAQNKQLIHVLNEKEKEIAGLQIKLVNCEDELRKLRKRNIELQDQMQRDQPLYRAHNARSVIKLNSNSPPPLNNQDIDIRNYPNDRDYQYQENPSYYQNPSVRTLQNQRTEEAAHPVNSHRAALEQPYDSFYTYIEGMQSQFQDHPISNQERNHTSMANIQDTLDSSKPQYTSNTNLIKLREQEQPETLMVDEQNNIKPSSQKIKAIKTLKEWLAYWQFFTDNSTGRFQLLQKLTKSDKLKEEFFTAGQPKLRVLRQALQINNSDIFEQAVILMGEVNDNKKLTLKECNEIKNEPVVVKCLRPKKVDETDSHYQVLVLSVFKILSHYNNLGQDWTENMTIQMNRNQGLRIICNYINSNDQQWQKLNALNFLHLIAKSKLMNPQILDIGIIENMLASLDQVSSDQILIGTLTVLSALFLDETCIKNIQEPNLLLKIIQLYDHQNNQVVSYCFDLSESIIPIFNFHQSLMKIDIFNRINEIAFSTAYPLCRANAMQLLRQMLDHAEPNQSEAINQHDYLCVLKNIEIPENENLKTQTIQRDVIHKSLKVLKILVQRHQFPDEQRLCSKLMRVFSNQNLHNDTKIEQQVLEIIHIIWDKIQPVLINHLSDHEVLLAVVEGYMQSENAVDNINYGLMLIGVCEKETYCSFILDNKKGNLLDCVLKSCLSEDKKVSMTASKILYYLVMDSQSIQYIEDQHIDLFVKVLNKDNMDEEFVNLNLQILFIMLKQVKLMKMLVNHNIIDVLFQILDQSNYTSAVMIKCFSCLEMIHNLYRERNLLRQLCVENQDTASDINIGVASVCLLKVQKEMGLSSLFFWRFLNQQSSSTQFANSIYHNQPDQVIMAFISLKREYRNLVPDISSQVSQILANLGNQNQTLREIVYEQDNL